jgi:hypothetical protein
MGGLRPFLRRTTARPFELAPVFLISEKGTGSRLLPSREYSSRAQGARPCRKLTIIPNLIRSTETSDSSSFWGGTLLWGRKACPLSF